MTRVYLAIARFGVAVPPFWNQGRTFPHPCRTGLPEKIWQTASGREPSLLTGR